MMAKSTYQQPSITDFYTLPSPGKVRIWETKEAYYNFWII